MNFLVERMQSSMEVALNQGGAELGSYCIDQTLQLILKTLLHFFLRAYGYNIDCNTSISPYNDDAVVKYVSPGTET